MELPNKHIKIKLDTSSLTAEDFDDISRWESEGGHTNGAPGLVASIPIPLHAKEIFEVLSSDIVVENDELFLEVELNLLSHH